MIPAFKDHAHDSLIPELRALASDDRVPSSPAVQVTTPERTGHWSIYVELWLDQGFYHNVEHGISRHVEAFGFLSTLKLAAISGAIDRVEDEIHDIGSNLTESQDVIAYTQMLLRSCDSEVTLHRQLYKRQLKISLRKYKHFMRTLNHYHKVIANLRSIHSEETKRTCDVEDSQAAGPDTPEST
ncbi:uncharacterized protein MELLADRAFT_91595 [Melampsora larici-populina 98AG31]|uniref:Uncharacterized protein n=1 Tax=Melampsora larici-populina (strain 98AG31 / pathotype 3-4-7) TaxID=747676 RepID=F4RZL7_MELLP|nr:uncharacterized protein MELLADRAFT_91595 [Melampsora larici-populina 98AG31]EGG02167.1 hypothetical protein MELLADRAFT_91595 [Melampsora larici-populina 98AG31]